MDILERIIEHLTSDEVRRFKILSNRFKADEEKKLLVLFDAIRGGNYKEIEKDIVIQLYGSISPKTKNTYYRLRNKLLSNLEKSLLFYHYNYKNSIESLSNLQLSMLYQERGLYREGFYSLKKAEKVALEQDQFQILEVVYSEMVKLAIHHNVDIDQVIKRRKVNQEKIDFLRANQEVLGTVTQSLMRRNFSRSKSSSSLIETLEEVQAQLEEHEHLFLSASGRIMILRTVVSILIQKSAWDNLATYAQKIFAEFIEEKIFNADNHPTRLMLLIWRINALHKLLRLDEATPVIEELGKAIKMYKRQNFNEFAFHYFSAKAFNLKYNGHLREAEKVIQQSLATPDIIHHSMNEVYLLISLADQYFSQQEYAKATDTILRIESLPGAGNLDMELNMYIHVFKIVTQYENEEYKVVDKQVKALRKKYKKLLKDDFYTKIERFLEIVSRMNTAKLEGKRMMLKAAVDGYMKEFPDSEIGGNEIIMYELYLRSKVDEEHSYYDLLTQEAVKQTQ